MAELLYLTNFPEINIVEKTLLNAAMVAGDTSVVVKNVQNFSVDDFVIIGRVASEQAEKLQLTASTLASQTLGFAACKFAHPKLEEVTKIRGDIIRVYRAADVDGNQPDDDSFILVNPVTINVKRSYTEYNDADGGVGYWYKITYYNSDTGDETDISESPAVRGGNYGHYATIEQVRTTSGLVGNSDVTDEVVAQARDEAESTVKGYIIAGGYVLPIEEPYPPSVVRLVKQLASAFLLQDEFGASVQGTNRDGFEQEKSVIAKLEAIQKGEIQLIDVNKETIKEKKDSVGGWPDDSTETESVSNHGGAPRFTMGRKW